jgi:CDP-diacylglycerol pyrophosphatase
MKQNLSIHFVVVIAVLMSGCAKTIWMNPNKPDKQAQIDLAECQRNAERKNEIMQTCMSSKGYYLEASK